MNTTNKKVDVILFNPAPRSGWQAQRRVELPLSLLSTATPLDRQGYHIKIIDEFDNPNWERELRDAFTEKPICFGVTTMTGPQILHALEGCKVVRQIFPDLPIVWGGIHASLLPEQTLQNPYCDIVVVGEGEATFEALVKTLGSGAPLVDVKGICFKDNGGIQRTETRPFVNLNEQPPLSYHLIDMNHYKRRLFGRDHISFNSSRGCTYRCSFCWDPVMHKRRWRAMTPGVVVDHLKRLIKDYGVRGFLFTDDHFFIDMDRAYRILDTIVRSGLKISISKLQIRADTILKMDRDFLELLVKAGTKRVSVGVESGNQRVLDLIKKDLLVEEVIEANQKLMSYPIVPVYLFMMGLPTETPEELADSIALAVRLTDENSRAVKTFNIFTPYPGTKIFETCVHLGLNEPRCLEEWSHFNFRNIPQQSKWIRPKMKKLIEGLDFPLMFLGKGHFITPYKKTHPLVVSLARMYYPVAKYRVKHLDARFPIETRLIKAFGLFGRQD